MGLDTSLFAVLGRAFCVLWWLWRSWLPHRIVTPARVGSSPTSHPISSYLEKWFVPLISMLQQRYAFDLDPNVIPGESVPAFPCGNLGLSTLRGGRIEFSLAIQS